MEYALVICLCFGAALHAAGPELIVYNGRIATVDPAFSVREAMAVEAVSYTHLTLPTKRIV